MSASAVQWVYCLDCQRPDCNHRGLMRGWKDPVDMNQWVEVHRASGHRVALVEFEPSDSIRSMIGVAVQSFAESLLSQGIVPLVAPGSVHDLNEEDE